MEDNYGDHDETKYPPPSRTAHSEHASDNTPA
jgi:hypothetical protein